MKESGSLDIQSGWRWLDGTVYSWMNWHNSEPDGDHGVTAMQRSGSWWGHDRTNSYRYICMERQIPGIHA